MRALRWMVVAGLVVAGCGTDEPATSSPSDDVLDGPTTVLDGEESIDEEPIDQQTIDQQPIDQADVPAEPVEPVTEASDEVGSTTFTTFTTADGLPADRVVQIDVGVDGTVWAALDGGRSARFDGDGWTDIGAAELSGGDAGAEPLGLVGMQLIGGADGVLWLVSSGFDAMVGAVAYDGERWLAPVDTGITATGAASPDGSLWMFGIDLDSDEQVVLYRLGDGVLTPQPAPEGGFECVYCGTYDVDADGTFWRYATGVIQRFDGATWTVFHSDPAGAAGTTEESVVQLGVDGSHWIIGRSEDGPTPWVAARIRPDVITRMPLGDGTEDVDEVQGRVRAMTGDANGRLWIAVDEHGLVCVDVDAQTVTEYGAEMLPSLVFSDLDAAPDGSVWVGTDAGITRIVAGG